jgi:DnaK suppressor protein
VSTKTPRGRIEAIRQRLLGEVARLRQRLRDSETASLGELSSYDNHPADLASSTWARSLDLGLKQGYERRLREAERALAKVEEGSWGRCDRCGGPIEGDRLAVRPWAVYCQRCQRQVEEEEAGVQATSYAAIRPVPWDSVHSLWAWGSSDSPQDAPPAVDYQALDAEDARPPGVVEPVEGWVGAEGEPLWDAVRRQPHREGRDLAQESDEY